jgi:isocitrate/isopropylmalate dehydrogenase
VNFTVFRQGAVVAHLVTLIPGDGIGPEVAEAARRVLDSTGEVRRPDLGGTSTTTEVAGSIVSALGG